MPDFKAKMHQIVCRLGLRPRPHWGSLQRPQLDFRGLFPRKGREKGGNGRGPLLSHYTPSHYILDKGLSPTSLWPLLTVALHGIGWNWD